MAHDPLWIREAIPPEKVTKLWTFSVGTSLILTLNLSHQSWQFKSRITFLKYGWGMPRNAKFSTNSKKCNSQRFKISRHQLVAKCTFLGEKHLNSRDLNYMAQHKVKCQQMILKWNPNNSVLKIVSDCTGTCQNTNWWSNQVEPASQILWAVSLLLHHHLSTLIFLVCWLSVILFNVKTWKFQWGGVLDIYLFKGSQKCRELGLCGWRKQKLSRICSGWWCLPDSSKCWDREIFKMSDSAQSHCQPDHNWHLQIASSSSPCGCSRCVLLNPECEPGSGRKWSKLKGDSSKT